MCEKGRYVYKRAVRVRWLERCSWLDAEKVTRSVGIRRVSEGWKGECRMDV